MENVEKILSYHLNEDKELRYPDFDAMWGNIQNDRYHSEGDAVRATQLRTRFKFRKAVITTSVAVLILATPVYAALHVEWSEILSGRSGVQSALKQGLGQVLEKSVTHDGVILTLHTAIVDDNRTVILYSLDLGDDPSKLWQFSNMTLQDEKGVVIEGRYSSQKWDEQNKRFTGYFETEWTPDGEEARVQFTASNLQFLSNVERDILFNPLDDSVQTFDIKQDGIEKVSVQSFVQDKNTAMISSSVTYNQSEVKAWAYPWIEVKKGDKTIYDLGDGVYGTPGEQGEYVSQQFYRLSDLKKEAITYQLDYTREEKRLNKQWNFDLVLNKTQMLTGTFKRNIDIPLNYGVKGAVLKEMVVTPTQVNIKVSHKDKYLRLPYAKYALDVNGTLLDGGVWFDSSDEGTQPNETSFRFELPSEVRITEDTPVTWVQRYEVITHSGGTDPIQLQDIKEEKKSTVTKVDGYAVKWTYYTKDGNLYVESESSDRNFGGVNQTYRLVEGKRNYGKPLTANFSGDGKNKSIDIYKDFEGIDAEVYIWKYDIEDPNKVEKIEILPRLK
ncbi:DUF4179 domain-containing protein [Paenibacillus sp. IHBB 10380]|uniref:DUF4179 domain-containing protein n=1 Tax=Paenibacillus sp. IHBB 10380 TaxID=1566358 RepID=UPI0005CFEB4C|nr:DUF4179 domain-containing protein [Paenibacillus sp. IHBB 10380]